MEGHPVYKSIEDAKKAEDELSPCGYAATKHEAMKVGQGQQQDGVVVDAWVIPINRGEAGVVECWILKTKSSKPWWEHRARRR